MCKQAIIEASKTKTERPNVKKILDNIDYYAEELRDMVLNDTFIPSPYGYEERIEHGKRRRLQKPRFFPDQAIHHVLIIPIREWLMKRIDPNAVASIPTRGQGHARSHLQRWLRDEANKRNIKYCAKGDIKQCFDSVTPEVIMGFWQTAIKDPLWLSLMSKVAYSCTSLPLGNYCSAWLLNVMLKPMDEAIRKSPSVKFYVRYMDDFVMFGSNRRKMKELREIVIEELAKLNLELKPNYQLFSFYERGLDFIGYRFFYKHTVLRKRNYAHIIKQAKELNKKKFITVHDAQSFISRIGMLNHAHCPDLFKKVGRLVNIPFLKKIISEKSKCDAAQNKGEIYKPSVLLL